MNLNLILSSISAIKKSNRLEATFTKQWFYYFLIGTLFFLLIRSTGVAILTFDPEKVIPVVIMLLIVAAIFLKHKYLSYLVEAWAFLDLIVISGFKIVTYFLLYNSGNYDLPIQKIGMYALFILIGIVLIYGSNTYIQLKEKS